MFYIWKTAAVSLKIVYFLLAQLFIILHHEKGTQVLLV